MKCTLKSTNTLQIC